MNDTWFTFPASMGEHLAWITYNHGYFDAADTDPRDAIFRIQIELLEPTPEGLPNREEFEVLNGLEDTLTKKIEDLGGLYVGRLTVAGVRVLYYYLQTGVKGLEAGLEALPIDTTAHKLKFSLEADPDKTRYWEELVPTSDDWQVIQDMKILETLAEGGDDPNKTRDVFHWAYFETKKAADEYGAWAKVQGYVVSEEAKKDDEEKYGVKFVTSSSMQLGEITAQTIHANRKAIELDGEYDGWETSVEKIED